MKGLTFEIDGIITVIYDEQQITSKFIKRTFKVFVLNEKNEQYSDVFELELKNDKCGLLDQYNIGDAVNCKCGLSGRDWLDRNGDPVYDKLGRQINSTTINCWYIVPLDRSDLEGIEQEEEPKFSNPDELDIAEEELYNTSSQDTEFDNMPEGDIPF